MIVSVGLAAASARGDRYPGRMPTAGTVEAMGSIVKKSRQVTQVNTPSTEALIGNQIKLRTWLRSESCSLTLREHDII